MLARRASEGIGCASGAGPGKRPSLARRVSINRSRSHAVRNLFVSRAKIPIPRKLGESQADSDQTAWRQARIRYNRLRRREFFPAMFVEPVRGRLG